MGFVSTAIHGWRHAGLRLARTLAAALALAVPAVAAAAAPVTVLQLQGPIGPASADYLERGIHKAGEAGAPLVVIQLDTPGGLDTSMRQVIQAILASPVPVAVFVSPEGARAASAGTYILYAAHVAAMAPATTLGAATPVAIGFPSGGERKPPAKDEEASKGAGKPASPSSSPAEGPQDAMTAKQVHDAAAFIRGLAQLRGRNAEWAERAVREAVSLTADEALKARGDRRDREGRAGPAGADRRPQGACTGRRSPARHPRRGLRDPAARLAATGARGDHPSERRADPDDDRRLRAVLRIRRARPWRFGRGRHDLPAAGALCAAAAAGELRRRWR